MPQVSNFSWMNMFMFSTGVFCLLLIMLSYSPLFLCKTPSLTFNSLKYVFLV